jgi:hypothetical protein
MTPREYPIIKEVHELRAEVERLRDTIKMLEQDKRQMLALWAAETKRLTAEIERLTNDADNYRRAYELTKAEVERALELKP